MSQTNPQGSVDEIRQQLEEVLEAHVADPDEKPSASYINLINDLASFVETATQRAAVEARLMELEQLLEFLTAAKIYDQDAAMKLRYHFNQRIKELRERLQVLAEGEEQTDETIRQN